MKKGFFLMMLLAAGMSVMAQVTTTTTTTSTTSMNNTMDNNSIILLSTGDYSAYSAPSNVQLYFNRDYPMVNTTVNWMPVGDYWRATYNNNGRYSHVFYTSNGDHYLVNLPVTASYVPDDIITASATTHPGTVYDINTLKAWDGSNVYQIRYIENGTVTSQFIDDNGNTVTDYWRTEDMQKKMDERHMQMMQMHMQDTDMKNMNMNGMDMNGSKIEKMKIKNDGKETKIKTEYKDGKETKTKVKNHNL